MPGSIFARPPAPGGIFGQRYGGVFGADDPLYSEMLARQVADKAIKSHSPREPLMIQRLAGALARYSPGNFEGMAQRAQEAPGQVRGLYNDAVSALTLPGDVYSGAQPTMVPDTGQGSTSPQLADRTGELAGMLTLGAGAVPAEANALRMGARAMPKTANDLLIEKVLKENRANKFSPDDPLIKKILNVINESPHAYHGLRIDDGAEYPLGSAMPNSRVWADGEVTGSEVEGSSTIGLPDSPSEKDIKDALEGLAPYFGDRLHVVGGSHESYGEDASESILRNPASLLSLSDKELELLAKELEEKAAAPPPFVAENNTAAGIGPAGEGLGAPDALLPPKPSIRAYHGSPHDFDKFSMDKIGTGEGAQAYGHGLYFAENEGVAKGYRDRLSIGTAPADQRVLFYLAKANDDPALAKKLMQEDLGLSDNHPLVEALGKSRGRTYEVDIAADPEHFLDWDKPLSEQSPSVIEKLHKGGWEVPKSFDLAPLEKMAARDGPDSWAAMQLDAMRSMAARPASEIAPKTPEAMKAARDAGIPGIRYMDQGSRGTVGGDLIGIEKVPGGFKAKIRSKASDSFTWNTKPFATEAEAQAWAEKKIKSMATSNYVVFDDKLISVLKKYGLPITAAGAAALAQMHPGEAQARGR